MKRFCIRSSLMKPWKVRRACPALDSPYWGCSRNRTWEGWRSERGRVESEFCCVVRQQTEQKGREGRKEDYWLTHKVACAMCMKSVEWRYNLYHRRGRKPKLSGAELRVCGEDLSLPLCVRTTKGFQGWTEVTPAAGPNNCSLPALLPSSQSDRDTGQWHLTQSL